MLLAPINVVLELDPYLPLGGLVPDKRMLQQLLCVGPLVIVLDQHGLNKAVELLSPLLGLEPWRRIAWDKEERPHGMHVAKRRLGLRHFQGSDAQAPQIRTVVVGCLGIVFASDHLRRHPVGRPDERVPPTDRPVELGTHAKVNCTQKCNSVPD